MRLLGLLLLATSALADPFGPPVKHVAEGVSRVTVASTAKGALAVWLENGGVVKANGNVVTPSAVRVAAASAGDFALVVWTHSDGSVRAVRRRADGRAAGVSRRIGSNAAGPIAVAAAGDRYFVVWAGRMGEVYAAITSPLGDPLVPATPVTAQSHTSITEIAAAASADGFAAVWSAWPDENVLAITLTASGAPVSMTPLLLSDAGSWPDVTSDGGSFLAVWDEGERGSIRARTITTDRELGRVRTITTGFRPRLAWDGSAYGLAFARFVSPRPGFSFPVLFVIRVSVYGTALEQLPLQGPLLPGVFDIDARDGRLDLTRLSEEVLVYSAAVREPWRRARAVRH